MARVHISFVIDSARGTSRSMGLAGIFVGGLVSMSPAPAVADDCCHSSSHSLFFASAGIIATQTLLDQVQPSLQSNLENIRDRLQRPASGTTAPPVRGGRIAYAEEVNDLWPRLG